MAAVRTAGRRRDLPHRWVLRRLRNAGAGRWSRRGGRPPMPAGTGGGSMSDTCTAGGAQPAHHHRRRKRRQVRRQRLGHLPWVPAHPLHSSIHGRSSPLPQRLLCHRLRQLLLRDSSPWTTAHRRLRLRHEQHRSDRRGHLLEAILPSSQHCRCAQPCPEAPLLPQLLDLPYPPVPYPPSPLQAAASAAGAAPPAWLL